jgi:PAT family beta-lactamase induction signal transducer AmpG
MAVTLGICVAATFAAPEPEIKISPPTRLRDAVILPFIEFFKRTGALEMIFFIVLYKLDVVMAVALTTPFMLELGFSPTDIGAVTKGFGLISSIVGTLGGGALMVRLGLKRSLWAFGLFQAVSNLTFMGLAYAGHSYSWMIASITLENFCSGMGNAAFFAFLMSICDKRFTATQFALLSALTALTRVLGGAPTGYLVKSLGWPHFFIVCTFASIPGLLLLTRFPRWGSPHEA